MFDTFSILFVSGVNQSHLIPYTMSNIISLFISIFLLIVTANCCQLPRFTFPNPAKDDLSNTSGCNFPIQQSHNWTMLNLQLPALDPANPDWKDMFRYFETRQACLQIRVSYTINQDIGLHFLEIGVDCWGNGLPAPLKFELSSVLQGTDDFNLSVEYSKGRFTMSRNCTEFGRKQRFVLDVGESLRIIQNDTTVMIIGTAAIEDSDHYGPCNCGSIRAYELQLKECHLQVSTQAITNEKAIRKEVLTVQASVDNRVWLITIILISVGVLLMAITYGSACIERDC